MGASTRYNRQERLPEFGSEGQSRLRRSSVLVIGAGGLGCPVLLYLVSAGVGRIGIVDPDRVDISNLHRQVLFDETTVGRLKVEVAQEKLNLINTETVIDIYPVQLNATNAKDIVASYDLIVDGSDNFDTRYLVNDVSMLLDKPVIFGAIFKFEGQVSVFNLSISGTDRGPTYRCLFPEPPPRDFIPNCAEIGVIATLPGIIGTIMASEGIKVLSGVGQPLSGKLFRYNSLDGSASTISFKRKMDKDSIREVGTVMTRCNMPKVVSVKELKEMMDRGSDFQLVDVRETYEYEICNLGGELIPMTELESNIAKISRDKPVVVHCHHGGRSMRAIQFLMESHNFNNLMNLTGGIDAWSVEIDPKVRRY